MPKMARLSLTKQLQMSEPQINTWFQNRRTKAKQDGEWISYWLKRKQSHNQLKKESKKSLYAACISKSKPGNVE